MYNGLALFSARAISALTVDAGQTEASNGIRQNRTILSSFSTFWKQLVAISIDVTFGYAKEL